MSLQVISDAIVERTADALGGAPAAAYTTPVVYPWSVQNFETRPGAERPQPPNGHRLYLHVPFCRYVCTFCFYAVRGGSKLPEMERYVAALASELSRFEAGGTLSKLIIGGGTPTALPPELLDAIFESVFARLTPPPRHACKVEASPDSLSQAHLDVLKRRGIGWVSVGIESLEENVLQEVRRRHTAEQAFAACRQVTDNGLHLNVDLIYGLPGQTETGFRRDLEAVAATGARSICLYALRLNEKTRIASQLSVEERLDLGRLMRWRSLVNRATAELGYARRRPYTFVRRDGERDFGAVRDAGTRDELALGMSARSQIADVVYRNHERFEDYLARVEQGQSPVETVFELDAGDRKTQLLARTLGSGAPLPRQAYAGDFGRPIEDDFGPVLARLAAAELLTDEDGVIALTETGQLVYDRVLLCFYSHRAQDFLRNAPVKRQLLEIGR